jgi:hypothetical protein
MKIAIAALFCMLLAAPAFGQQVEEKPDYFMRAGFVSLAALTAADIDLSRSAMSKGAKEVNPVFDDLPPGAFGLVNGALNGAAGLIAYKVHKSGKKRTARIMMAIFLITKTAVVAHNYRVDQRQGK